MRLSQYVLKLKTNVTGTTILNDSIKRILIKTQVRNTSHSFRFLIEKYV